MDSDTLNSIGIPAEGCWIRPSWRPVTATTSGAGFTRALEETGQANDRRNLTCSGWSSKSGSNRALVIQPTGGFSGENCDIPRPVTCCAPVPIPEPSASLSLPIGAVGLAGLSMLKGGA